MTYEEAKAELIDFPHFCSLACLHCNNDWYCPSYCDALEKASKMDFDLIVRCYARNNGEMWKVFRYIKGRKR